MPTTISKMRAQRDCDALLIIAIGTEMEGVFSDLGHENLFDQSYSTSHNCCNQAFSPACAVCSPHPRVCLTVATPSDITACTAESWLSHLKPLASNRKLLRLHTS
jgi:hypothetical protein